MMNDNDEYDGDQILEWILGIGPVHSEIDHRNFRKALKEASKSQNSADFNHIPKLDAHPETFLIQRFDKEMNDIADEINANQGETSSIRHPFGNMLDHPNLKQLTKRDLSLHKRNMEIRALSRASVLSLIENQPDPSPTKNSRKNSINPKRNGSMRASRMSGLDFFATAATAAAIVGLDDIAHNLETSSIGFENNNNNINDGGSIEDKDYDNFETENIFPDESDTDSPDKFSNIIQYSPNHSREFETSLSTSIQNNSAGRHTFHSNNRTTAATGGAIEEYTYIRNRSFSTNSLEDMVRDIKSNTDLFDNIVSASNRPKTSGADRPKVIDGHRLKFTASNRPKTGGGESSKPNTLDAMIGIRSKLKFEGASIESPYFYHMTKEVHNLVIDAPPPGIPVKRSTTPSKPDAKKRGNSASNANNPNNNNNTLSVGLTIKMPKIVDKYIQSTSNTSQFFDQGNGHLMTNMTLKLPSGIQLQQQAMFSPPNTSVSGKFSSIGGIEPLRNPSPLITSRNQKFSLEVREFNDSVNSVLEPPGSIALNRDNSTNNLYKSNNLSHQSVGSSSSGFSEHHSSRVSPPGLLHIQPKQKSQSIRSTVLPCGQLTSSSRLPSNRKMSIDFLVSSISSTAELKYESTSTDQQHQYHQDNKVATSQQFKSSPVHQRDKRHDIKGNIEITNLHSDPLYRILQEEIESLYSDNAADNNAMKPKITSAAQPFQSINYMLVSTNDSRVISAQRNQQQNLDSPQINFSKKNNKISKVRNSKTGLSDYRTRALGSAIKPADLKILCSFKSLPSAVWFTCRITYFLIVAYYELMIRYDRNYELQQYLNMDELWRLLEKQIVDYSITMETIEAIYSWPLLQVIIEKYPIHFTRLLYNIEKYGPSNQGSLAQASQVSASSWVEDSCSDVFYDIFPPFLLVCLRRMVKQGMRIFQSQDLRHTVIVSAQLCDWSKRVMAGIYASCLTRLRAKQSIGNTSHSELHSTSYYNSSKLSTSAISIKNDVVVPKSESHRLQRIFSSSLYGTSVYGNSAVKIQVPNDVAAINVETTMVPHFTFVVALEDVFNSQSFFDIKNILSKNQGIPWNTNENTTTNITIADQYLLRNSILPSDTLVRGLGLVKPTDRLDLLLIPPDINDIDNQLSIVKFTSPISNNAMESHVESTVKQLLDIWLAIRNVYIDHVQYYSSSPFHRVCILPIDKTDIIRQQQSNRDQFTDNNMILQVNDEITTKLLFPYVLSQDKGIHPVIEHALCYEYSTTTTNNNKTNAVTISHVTSINNHVQNNNNNNNNNTLSIQSTQSSNIMNTLRNHKIQADILVTHLRNGKIPQYFSSLNDIRQIDFKFSLVLIDDFSPNSTITRPLSRYSSSLITQTQSSQPLQSQSHQSQSYNSQSHQLKPIMKRMIKENKDIEPVVASATGPNTYIVCVTDKITSWIAFQMACRLAKPSDTIILVHIPVISNYNLKSIHKQQQHTSTTTNKQDNKCYLSFSDFIKQKQSCEKRIENLIRLYKDSGFNIYIDSIPTYEEELYRYLVYNQRDLYYESLINHYDHIEYYKENNNKAPEYFLMNQHIYHISSRLVSIINEFTPDFVIIGGKCVDVQDILSLGNSHSQGITTSSSYNYSSVSDNTKDLNFPYIQTVVDNTVDIVRLQAEMEDDPRNPLVSHQLLHTLATASNKRRKRGGGSVLSDELGSSRSIQSSSDSYYNGGLVSEKGIYIENSSVGLSSSYNNNNSNGVIVEEGTEDIYDFDSFEKDHSEVLPTIRNSISDEDNYSGDLFEDSSSLQQGGKSRHDKDQIVIKPSDATAKLIINPHSLSLQSIQQPKLTSKQKLKELIKYIEYAKKKVSLSEMLLHQYISIHYNNNKQPQQQQNSSNSPNYYNHIDNQHTNSNNSINNEGDEDVLEIIMEMKRFSLIISNSNAF